MADAIKGAIKAFVVTFIVVAAVAAMPFAAGTAIAVEGAALTLAALSAGMTLVSGLFTKDIDASLENFGTKVAGRAPTAARPIIYGMARLGGTIVHMETAGVDNHKLRMVIALAGHEVESLEEVHVNGEKLTTTSSGGFDVATNSKFTNTDNDNAFTSGRLLRYKFKDGSQTAADSTITSNSALGSGAKFKEVAYVFVECVFDSEKFGGGVPQFFFVIKGKKVYDPRTDTTYWSDNPALCVRDYLVNTRYGLRATSNEINDTTNLGGFASAANSCETGATISTATVASAVNNSTTVTITSSSPALIPRNCKVTGTGISGTVRVARRNVNTLTLDTAVTIASGVTITFTEDGFTCNGFTNMAADGSSVIQGLLSSCAGKLSYINGKFIMFAGANVTPEMTINDENFLAPMKITTNAGGGENYNTVKAVYVNSQVDYTSEHTPTYTDTTLLNADTPNGESTANYIKNLETQLPFTVTSAMAQRLQKIQLLYARQQTTISALVNIAYLQVQPFDRVYVNNSRTGYVNKQFEVLSTRLEIMQSDGADVLANRLELKEIDNSVYNFVEADYTTPEEEGDGGETGDYSVTAPSSLSLAQRSELDGPNLKCDIEATWVNNSDDLVMGTEVAYKLSTDAAYEGHFTIGKGETKALIPNVVVGKTYNVKVRHFSVNNVFSDYTSAVNLAIADPNSMGTPSSFTATGHRVGIILEWTNPNNTNLRAVKIYRKTSNSTPTNDTNLVHTMMGEPNAKSIMFQGAMDGLVAGTTYFFWLRAISHTGVHSSFTSSVSASYSVYDKGDIGLNNVTNDTQIKDDGSNAPNLLKNDQISISKSGGAVRLTNTGSNTDVTLDNSDIGLSNVTNHAQVKNDLSNFSFLSDDFEVDSGNFKAKNALKNAQISIGSDGSLTGAGGGQVTAVGVGAVKTDASNAPNSLKNDQVTLSKDGSGNLSLDNAGSGNVSFDNSDVGLGNVTNDAQIKTDGSNAPNILKNDQVTLAKDGSGNLSLSNAGSGNVSFDNSDVGLGNVTNDAQIKTDGSNAPNALKNNQISISSAGVLSNAGGGTVSATGLGAVKTDLTNAPASIKNENTTATDVGLSNVTNDAQVKSDGSNAPNILKNDQITLSLTGTTLGLNNAGSGNQTLGKANVGLSDLASLDSTRSGKLDGVATGSTNNGSTIDTNGNITGNMSVGATMTLGSNSDDKIVVGNITIDGGNGRILITD